MFYLAQAHTPSEDPSMGVWIGFIVLLAFFVLILTRGNPRPSAEVVESQTPDRWKDSPLSAEKRRKAAAAAVAAHLHAPKNTSQ
jgi:hypothetical protein